MSYLSSLLEKIIRQPEVQRARAALLDAEPHRSALGGLTIPAKALVLAALARDLSHPCIVITSDNAAAERLARTATVAYGWLDPSDQAAVGVLPASDTTPYDGRSPHPEIAERRAVALLNLVRGKTHLLFVPLSAALGRFRQDSYYASLQLDLKAGDEVSLLDLIEHLNAVGYEAGEPVASPGQYSIRGGIVDIFSPETEWPSRLEFLGDSIESIREYDPESQRSRKAQPSVHILPFSEHQRSAKLFAKLVETLSARAPSKRGEPEWQAEYSAPFPGWEFFVPLAEPHRHTLFSLVKEPIVVWDEPAERVAQLQKMLESLHAANDEVRDVVPPRPRPEEVFLTEKEFLRSLDSPPTLSLRELAVEGMAGSPALSIPTQPGPKFHGAVKSIVEDLNERRAQGETMIVVLPTAGKVDRLREILTEYEVPFDLDRAGAPAETLPAPAIIVARGDLEEGVVFPDLRVALLSDSDLFGEFIWGAHGRREKSVATSFISDLSDLKPGDYVVHIDHGIGQYQGLRPLEVEVSRRDFMLLTFQEDARLYVPARAARPGGEIPSRGRGRKTRARPTGRRHVGAHQDARQARAARHRTGASAPLRRAQDASGNGLHRRHAVAEGI